MYPTTNLSYGQTSADVTKLQNFLISQGFAIPAGATGYFGDQTKAALLAWQQKNGVQAPASDLGSNWGPLSIAAASKTPTTSTTTGGSTSSTSTSTGTVQPTQTSSAPAALPGGVYSATLNSDGTYTFDTNTKYGRSTVNVDPSNVAGANAVFASLGISSSLLPQLTSYLNPSAASASAPSSQNNGGSTATGVQPPTVNLQPGDTGDQVKKLQDYLVSKGLMTQAQVDTGYGTYGPQTTAAVAALQKSLGVDNSTGVGYFGPRTISAIGSSASAAGGTAGTSTNDPALTAILNNPNLSADQKAAIQGIFDAVSTNDSDRAAKIQAAMKAASEFSDPYFKAQTRLAIDALDRGLNQKDGDLHFSEGQLTSALAELKGNTAASEDKLSFDHAQELKQLQTKYETDLSTTQDNLAASGFTSSSKRARAEQILGENNTGLVESSNKNYSYQTGNLDRSLAASSASTEAQIANLQRLNDAGKLDLYRTTEGNVGSAALPAEDGLAPLGDIGGDIPRKQATDAFSFASNFVS